MFELAEWQRRAVALNFPDHAVIDGQHCAAQSGQTFAAINPATGQCLANVAACGEADVDAAVRNARQVFEAGTWSQRPPAERKQVLLRLADLLMTHRDELALLDSLNMGKPVMDAYNIDVPGAAGVPLVRRSHRQALRSSRAQCAECVGDDYSRSARCGCGGSAVEFPVGHGRVETRASVGGGKFGDFKTG